MGGPHGPKAGVLRLLAALGALALGSSGLPALGDEPQPGALPPPKSRVLPRSPVPGAVPAPVAAPADPPPAPPAPAPPRPSAPPRPPAQPKPGAQPGGARGTDEEPPAADPDGLVKPTPRPPRPPGKPTAKPEDLEFLVERPGGVVQRFPDADGTAAWVMVGNPRVFGQAHTRKDGKQVEALSIKGNRLVVWIDESKVPNLSKLLKGTKSTPKASDDEMITAFFEEAVLGIFAEGAVEISYGTVLFRADSLYLEPRTFKGLLVQPRFDGRLAVAGVPDGLPLYARGRRGRLVARGLMVFDDAEVAVSRADDRISLRVRTLSMEEFDREQDAAMGTAPALLGFKNLSTQRYAAKDIQVWGERIPLARIPSAEFGGEGQEYPVTIKRVQGGIRSEFGLYAFVGVGGSLGPERKPWGEWIVDLGGYVERGPGVGGEVSWGKQKDARSKGSVESWYVYDHGTDSNGFDPEDNNRYRVVSENRTTLSRDLIFDAEFSEFSDRGFNREFFERDDLTHKDRESYLRMLYRPSTFAASLTGKWHQRDFVTETVEQPQAGGWATGVPLLTPGRVGGLGMDLTSVSQAGYLGRRFDEADLVDRPYDALRVDTDTRIEAGMDVGDVRLSSWTGVSIDSYQQRTDGGEDLTRTALVAGVRANVQAHRVFGAHGGPFELDGLRHIMDVDLEASGRFLDSADPAEVPYFDQREQEEQRSELAIRWRNRLQTRRPKGGALRNVADLETTFHWYADDVAPYLQRTPWGFTWSFMGEPLESRRLYVASEGDVDAFLGVISATASVGYRPDPKWDFVIAYRYLQDEAAAPLFQASWRWSEKYSLRVTESYNFRNDDNELKVLFRRHSNDHVWSFGFKLEDNGDVGFELDFRPTIGVVGETPSVFEDEVDLDPTRAFR